MRSSNIELLRIVSMFLIVVHHLSVQTAWPDLSGDLATQSAVRVLAFGGKIGVDIFVLITGYFMVRSRFKSRSFLRTALETWFYSWTLLAMFAIAGWGISRGQLFEGLAPLLTGKYWFVTTYLALYLFIPLLNRLIAGMSRHSLRLLICIGFVVFSLAPTVTTYGPLAENLPWFFFLYIVGGYIRLSDASGSDRSAEAAEAGGMMRLLNPADLVKRHPLAWCIGSFAVIVASIVGLTYAYALNGFDFMWWSSLIMQHKVPALLMAVSMFWLFKRMPLPCSNLVNSLGAATFGVYLIHEQQFVRIWLWDKVTFLADFGPAGVIVGGLAICVVVYAVCSVVDIVRKYVFDGPLMRFIDRRCGRALDRIDKAMTFE